METGGSGNGKSYIYVGLAGETALARVVKSGLYRTVAGGDRWEQLSKGLPEKSINLGKILAENSLSR
jgi:hypothetical protein